MPRRSTAIACLILSSALIACRGGVSPGQLTSQPTDTPAVTPSTSAISSLSPSSTPRGNPDLQWTASEIVGSVNGVAFDADSKAWIALGRDVGGLAAWTSANGGSWSRGDVPAAAGPPPPGGFQQTTMGQVVRFGSSLYSLGIGTGGGDAHQPLVWQSTDGQAWQARDLPEPFATTADLVWGGASSPSVLLVLGHRFAAYTGSVWLTSDTKNWSESFPNGSGPATESGIDLHDVVFDGTQFVAVGETKVGAAAAWRSADRAAWTAGEGGPELASASMHSVSVAPGGGYVAVGTSHDGAAAWRSSDGRAWQGVDMTAASKGTVPYAVVQISEGLVALGTVGGRTAVWTSADGASWTPQASTLAGQIPPYIGGFGHDLVATDGQAVLVVVQSGDKTTLWKGTPIPR